MCDDPFAGAEVPPHIGIEQCSRTSGLKDCCREESNGDNELRTIATCAVREAANGPDFCRRAKEELGIQIDVISALPQAEVARLWQEMHDLAAAEQVTLLQISSAIPGVNGCSKSESLPTAERSSRLRESRR